MDYQVYIVATHLVLLLIKSLPKRIVLSEKSHEKGGSQIIFHVH